MLSEIGPIVSKIGPLVKEIEPIVHEVGPIVREVGPIVAEIGKEAIEDLKKEAPKLKECKDFWDKMFGGTDLIKSPLVLRPILGPPPFLDTKYAKKRISDACTGEKTDAPEKKGGSYKDVKKSSDGDTHEVHHMPADSASSLDRGDGPAIKMEKEDHRQTASCGSSREACEYRAKQQELIEQGKFREAVQMDIDDIHDKFGDKYDDAIDEMLKYVDKLEQEGKIDG